MKTSKFTDSQIKSLFRLSLRIVTGFAQGTFKVKCI